MSVELVGFENLPIAHIKNITITRANANQDTYEVTVRIHDLLDGSMWSDSSMPLMQLMRVGLVFSTDVTEIANLTKGEKPSPYRYITKPLRHKSNITEENLYYEVKFKDNFANNLKNLTVFAFCFISGQDISETLGIPVAINYFGPTKSEKILENSTIVSTTNAFLRSDNTYWPGTVHVANKQYMEGSYHKDTPHNILTKVSLINTKIQDLRDTNKTSEAKSQKIENYFSDLFVSYNSKTDINCLFMINIKTMLFNNTKFGSFLEKADASVINSLLNNVKFKVFSIEKQRIKLKYKSTGVGSLARRADKVFSKKNILNTYDDANRDILPKERYERNGSFDFLLGELENASDYKKIADIQELYFRYGPEIRTFQFTDYEMTSNTPGDYQYKIDLQFVDPVDKFLKTSLSDMKQDISDITMYLNYFSRGRDAVGFNTNKITQNYIKYYSYIYTIDKMQKRKMSLVNTNLLNRLTTSTANISKFLQKYRNLYNEFLTFMNHDEQKRKNTPTNIKSKDSASARIVVSKIFNQIITPSDNVMTFSYIPESNDRKTPVYTKSSFLNISQQQTEEQFVQQPNFASSQVISEVAAGLSDIQATSTAYFSPKNFKFGQSTSSMVGIDISGLNHLNVKMSQKVIKANRKPQAVANSTFKMPVTFVRVEVVPEPKQETEEEQFVDVGKIIGDSHEIARYTEQQDYNKITPRTRSHQKFMNKFSGFDKHRTFAATLEKVKKLDPQEAQMLPNQLKAVLNGQSTATRNDFVLNGNDLLSHPTSKNFYELKNFSVKEVVYIDRFEQDFDGNILLNKPVYKTMIPDNLSFLNKPALCFLIDYTNDKFDINGSESVQAVNSVFVIADESIYEKEGANVLDENPIYSTQDLEYQYMNSNIVVLTNTNQNRGY